MKRLSLAFALAITFAGIANTKASKKAISLEKRYGDNFVGVWTAIATANTNITSLFTDFSSLSGLVGNASFLANLSMLPHQTSSNGTISTSAGSLSNADRVTINGLVNAVNNLQSNLQSSGFES